MNLNLTDEQVSMIIAALAYYARMEAGQTQEPNLCDPEDFDEHALALDIERRLDRSIKLRAQWTTNEFGETVRIT